MHIEGGRIVNDFIEPNKRQYSIPVYQRNYEWSRDECIKLFNDIVQAYKKDKPHFCGSVVYAPLKEEHNIHYYVIVDGQQRLTTIYLLLKALIDCAKTENVKERLMESMFNTDKFDDYAVDAASKLKLKPIKSDNQQLYLLMENRYDEMEKSSDIWINYQIFKEQIEALLLADDSMDVKNIYKGIEKLTCAKIKLDADDNAQEIFERINSTGVPLNLADQIRNFVLMTDVNQDALYKKYWLKMEQLIQSSQMTPFLMDYLNFKIDGFTTDRTAYEDFKRLYVTGKYGNESMLEELLHYAQFYNAFMNGDEQYGPKINEYLNGLRQLKQTTVYLFLFRIFDDLNTGVIDQAIVEKVLQLLRNYSIRRLMCEISSNSLRGLYKTLYNRVFVNPEYKAPERYYDAIVSFLLQLNSRDVIPSDADFNYALGHYNLFRKHALCKFLLVGIENQGKEKVIADNLSIEHVMPQNKNLSTAWQQMLGENWAMDKDRWLDTLGNLTLTGYNSELGDKPFEEKKQLIEEKHTKVVILYQDIQNEEIWNADTIQKRAARLIEEVNKVYPIVKPLEMISFRDTRYKEYTCAEPKNATYKTVSYYVLRGERINVDGFAPMVQSVARKLYDWNPQVIKRMAKNEEKLFAWSFPAFSYDKEHAKNGAKLRDTDIYISTGFSAADCIWFIKGLLKKYDMNIDEDFVYCARASQKKSENIQG